MAAAERKLGFKEERCRRLPPATCSASSFARDDLVLSSERIGTPLTGAVEEVGVDHDPIFRNQPQATLHVTQPGISASSRILVVISPAIRYRNVFECLLRGNGLTDRWQRRVGVNHQREKEAIFTPADMNPSVGIQRAIVIRDSSDRCGGTSHKKNEQRSAEKAEHHFWQNVIAHQSLTVRRTSMQG